jgi:hypothetical protein
VVDPESIADLALIRSLVVGNNLLLVTENKNFFKFLLLPSTTNTPNMLMSIHFFTRKKWRNGPEHPGMCQKCHLIKMRNTILTNV